MTSIERGHSGPQIAAPQPTVGQRLARYDMEPSCFQNMINQAGYPALHPFVVLNGTARTGDSFYPQAIQSEPNGRYPRLSGLLMRAEANEQGIGMPAVYRVDAQVAPLSWRERVSRLFRGRSPMVLDVSLAAADSHASEQ